MDPPVSFEVLHFKEFDMKDLVFIHRVLDRCAKDIIVAVQSYSLEGNAEGCFFLKKKLSIGYFLVAR